MGLFGALYTGVSGLNVQSNKIGVISNNVANVNTVGYKESNVAFETLVVPSGTTTFSPGGVISDNQQLVGKQGLIQGTSSATDLAISGNGLFAVNTSSTPANGQVLFSRSGSFTQDNSGNFVNSDGNYLLGWALDSNGNKINTTNSTDPSALTVVNVQSDASGAATPTSTVSLAGNLNASQTVLLGAGEQVGFNSASTYNYQNPAANIIVGNDYGVASDSGITRGDQFTVTSGAAPNTPYTFTYGGFTVGRSVTDTTFAGDGDNTLNSTTYLNQSNVFSTTAGTKAITIAAPGNNFVVGQSVSVSGVGTNASVDGIPAAQINGTQVITARTANSITFATTTAASNGVTAAGGTGISFGALQPQSFLNQTNVLSTPAGAVAAGGTETVTVTSPTPTGYVTGQTVDIENVASTLDGIDPSQINGSHTITVTGPNTFTFTAISAAGSSGGVTGGGTGISYANRTYPFAGTMLDATTTAGAFLGTTTTAPFDPNALNFQIATTTSGTFTFKYTTGSPDPTQGQFNSLATLSTAINDTTGLNSRIVNGRLYVSANDANEGLTFINGQSTTTSNGKGIDWVSELGLQNVPAASTISPNIKRFDSLTTLSNEVNTVTALSSSISNPLGASLLSINSADPQQTISFADSTNIDGKANSGSLLKELGFSDYQGSPLTAVPPSSPNGFSTGTFPVEYDPNNPAKNMSGGKITPQFSRNVTIYDSLGISHTVAFNMAKTATNTWAVEVTAVPASDVVSGSRSDGQLASGYVTFKGDGSLASLTSQLNSKVNIQWADGAATSSIALNMGSINKTDGLSQYSSASNITSVTQNGSSSGQLTGVAIDSQGYVISSFSNGQTQKTFQIPLIQVNNPDGLDAVSGDAFKQTEASGQAVAVEAGTSGTGTIQASALEQSTVDLSSQLTSLIVAQQAYGANSKLLTVSDQLLQELDQIIQ